MKYALSTLLLLTSFAHADVSATTQDVRAFALPKDAMSIRASYNHVDDSVDLLNLNEKPLTSNPYSALGDTSGIDIALGYGAHRHLSFFYNYEALNIDYAGGEITNQKHDIYGRMNFYESPHYLFSAFSMDLGFIHNSSDDINAAMTDLSDDSYYVRLLLGNKFNASLFNIYAGAKYADISAHYQGTDLSRTEKSLMLGFTHTLEFSSYILDTKYEYSRMFNRGSIAGDENANHIIDIHLAKAFSDKFLLFIGTKIMLNQFNGTIPYLYNTQTAASFENAYSYLKLGFVYNFDFLSKEERQHYRKKQQGPQAISFFGY